MFKITLFTCLTTVFLCSSCSNTKQKIKPILIQSFDSSYLSVFFERYSIKKDEQENIQAFYDSTKNSFIWLNELGLNTHAINFIALLNDEDSLQKITNKSNKQNLQILYQTVFNNKSFNIKDTTAINLELLLTIGFFNYAQQHWEGISQVKIEQAGWFISKNKVSLIQRLNLCIKNDTTKSAIYKPVYRQYNLLSNTLKKYTVFEKNGTWLSNLMAAKTGDTSVKVGLLKQQLFLLEDLVLNNNTNVFDEALEVAVKKFQHRFGITEDGIVAGKTLRELNVPLKQRIEQLVINIERSKWMPIEQMGDYLAVNIPDFKLLVYNNDHLEWSCNVVVGKSTVSSNTIIFNDLLENIVFSPYWNIPSSILFKETLPSINRNSNYLNSHNMEIIDENNTVIPLSAIKQNQLGKNFPYNIRQRPGKNNALGLVKFLFPNNYNIYMHDTPEKSLFDEPNRMFSHGCIRVEEPIKLAKFLLRKDNSWSEEKIITAMNANKEMYVKLNDKIPVYITYFTAWVDRAGNVNFRDDIYGHDVKMKQFQF